jgi:nucleotide-binding universal stress UspA family protein
MVKETPGTDPIVVGVDGSESAAQAVRWAAKEAELTGSPLSIVHATALDTVYVPANLPLPRPYHQAVLEIGQQYLAAAATQARAVAPKVDVGVRLSRASAAPALIDLSSTARLVVVGSRGLGGFTGLLVGSTAVAVAAHGHCPLVVVRGGEPDAAAPIVAGADGSFESDAALALAFQAAELRDVPLVVVHAWHEGAIGGDWQQVADARVAAHRTRHPAVKAHSLIVRHGPARALLDEAAHAQLVVVGSRGRGGFLGLLLGSTSQALIHHSPCPVAVVPICR